MKQILVLTLAMLSTPALAFKEGTYHCKNIPGLPDNVYTFSKTSVGGDKEDLPYVDVVRYFQKKDNAGISTTHIRGIASVATVDETETLILGYLRFDFENDKLVGCKE